MTKINETVALKIKTLRDAGFGYKRIANQLELKAGTVKKHCQKLKSIEGLPPKIKQYKGQLVSRYSLLVKKYTLAKHERIQQLRRNFYFKLNLPSTN
jgi:biotin operon repressor